MFKYTPVNQEQDLSDFYISHEPIGSLTQTKNFQKLHCLQQCILQKIESLVGIGSLEKSIRSLLDDKFGQLSQQIKDINNKISKISNKLNQKQNQNSSLRKNQEDNDPFQKSNISAIESDSVLVIQDNFYSEKDPYYYPNGARFHSQNESNFEDDEQSNIILYDNDNYQWKLFDNNNLFKELQDVFKEMDLKFEKCQKLYDYEKMSQINFHQKIDNKMNIFLLMELENNELLGAFTHLSFDPQPNYIPRQNPKSFFCNFKKNIYVYASRYNRTHSYDPKYLIFGNWEIKIKACDRILESNWGTNGDCFMSKQYGRSQKTNIKLEWMFGVGFQNKSIKMKRYSIYQFI